MSRCFLSHAGSHRINEQKIFCFSKVWRFLRRGRAGKETTGIKLFEWKGGNAIAPLFVTRAWRLGGRKRVMSLKIFGGRASLSVAVANFGRQTRQRRTEILIQNDESTSRRKDPGVGSLLQSITPLKQNEVSYTHPLFGVGDQLV